MQHKQFGDDFEGGGDMDYIDYIEFCALYKKNVWFLYEGVLMHILSHIPKDNCIN